MDRLIPFLKKLPQEYNFAVEIRNKEWLDAQLAAVLRDFRVALVLQDKSWMPDPRELSQKFDPITADWTYIRWLGDRKAMENITQTWSKTVVDRSAQLSWWTDYCFQTTKRGVSVYGYANNHYGGHAPATIQQFRDLWSAKGLPELGEDSSEAAGGDTIRFVDRREATRLRRGVQVVPALGLEILLTIVVAPHQAIETNIDPRRRNAKYRNSQPRRIKHLRSRRRASSEGEL